jgi:hypothetical protein
MACSLRDNSISPLDRFSVEVERTSLSHVLRSLLLMSNKRFLAVGDLLINPDLLAYATFDEDEQGPRLRLGFATGSGASARAEVRLSGEEARHALRWLRLNTLSLTQEGAFGPIGPRVEGASLDRPETEAVDQAVRATGF